VDGLPGGFYGTTVTPAANHLFDMNEDCPKLNTKTCELFRHIVDHILFLAEHGHPDLLTGVDFLTTRVKAPDGDDMKKLKRIINYLRNTANLVLTLGSDGTGTMHWCVDAGFAVHHDMKSHTCG